VDAIEFLCLFQLSYILSAIEALPVQFQEEAKKPHMPGEDLQDVWVPTWEV
jgi:hypothetical protein